MKTGDNSKKSIVKIKKWIGDGKRQNMSDGENKRKKNIDMVMRNGDKQVDKMKEIVKKK